MVKESEMKTMQMKMILALGFTVSMAAACGEDAEPVDAQTTRQAITQNVDNIAGTLRDSAQFLEQSDLFGQGYGRVAVSGASEDCVSTPDGEFDCTSSEEPAEPFDSAMVDAPAAELVEFLTTRVFIDANVENATETEVTFLLRGQNVCAGLAAEDFAQCKTTLDNAQLRVKVSAPAAGDLDMALLVGESRAKPVVFNLWKKKLAAEVDLAATRAALVSLAGAAGEPAPELPATMSGKFKGSLEALGAKKLRASFAVSQAIQVSDGADTDIQIAVASPAMQAVVDGDSKTLTVAVDWKSIQIKAPMTTQVWDDEVPVDPNDPNAGFQPSEPRDVSHLLEVALGGISGTSVLDGAADSFSFQNLGLGDATTTVKVDGVSVFALDLNKDAGRRLSALLSEAGGDTKLELDPKLDLEMTFSFAQLADKEGIDYEPWMDNDTLSIIADGAAKPTLLLGDKLKVLAGKLTLKSSARAQVLEVNANQCLIDAGDEPTLCADGAEFCADPAPGESEPFPGLSAGACE
jgi:hypothetical protein